MTIKCERLSVCCSTFARRDNDDGSHHQSLDYCSSLFHRYFQLFSFYSGTPSQSHHIIDQLNPFWDEFTLPLEELCYGDLAWPLKLTVYDHNRNGNSCEIGDFETSIQGLVWRVAIRGVADRERAFGITEECEAKTRGLNVVLKADLRLD